MYKLLLGFTIISDVCRSFIPNKTTFTKSYSMDFKDPGSLEIHWVRQYLVNFTGLVDIVIATVYDKLVDHSDVVGASPVGAAPTTSSSST